VSIPCNTTPPRRMILTHLPLSEVK
jgi:hypothetical protein